MELQRFKDGVESQIVNCNGYSELYNNNSYLYEPAVLNQGYVLPLGVFWVGGMWGALIATQS